MATTYRWTGSTSEDWGTPANFNPNPATVPLTGDSVICGSEATRGISVNIDRTGDANGINTGLNLVLFEIEKGFNFNIGSSATPLKLTADKFVDRGGGELYFTSVTGTALEVTDLLVIDKDNIGKIVVIGSISNTGGAPWPATITRADIMRSANITIGGTITTLYITPRTGPFDVNAIWAPDNQGAMTIYMAGGTLYAEGTEGVASTIYLSGGSLEHDAQTGGSIGTLFQFGGMVLMSNGIITSYRALGGFMDSTGIGGNKTITALIRGPGFDYARNPKLTITTETILGD